MKIKAQISDKGIWAFAHEATIYVKLFNLSFTRTVIFI